MRLIWDWGGPHDGAGFWRPGVDCRFYGWRRFFVSWWKHEMHFGIAIDSTGLLLAFGPYEAGIFRR